MPANVADDGDEFTKRISEMVVDDVIRSVTRYPLYPLIKSEIAASILGAFNTKVFSIS